MSRIMNDEAIKLPVYLWGGFTVCNWRRHARPQAAPSEVIRLLRQSPHPAISNVDGGWGALPWDASFRCSRMALMIGSSNPTLLEQTLDDIEIEISTGNKSLGSVEASRFRSGRDDLENHSRLKHYGPLAFHPNFVRSLPVRSALLDGFREHEKKWTQGKKVHHFALPARQNLDIDLRLSLDLLKAYRSIADAPDLDAYPPSKSDKVREFQAVVIRVYVIGEISATRL